MNDFLALLERKKADLQAATAAPIPHLSTWPSSSAISRPPQPIQPPPPPSSSSQSSNSIPAPTLPSAAAAAQPHYYYNPQQISYSQPYPPMPFFPPSMGAYNHPMYLQPSHSVYAHPFHSPALDQNLYQIPPPQQLQPKQPSRPNKKAKPPSSSQTAPLPSAAAVESNQEFYCEPCDKSFKKEFDYQAHCKTHETCSHAGCSFVGSKKVVLAHYHSKHGLYAGDGYKTIDVEGQKFNLLLGYSPEEIENWKKERRAKFPTGTKVEEEKDRKKQNHSDSQKGKKKSVTNNKRLREDKNTIDSNGIKRKKTNHPASQSTLTIPKPLEGGVRGTLLKKLLADQIFEEEELVLACINYLCENNFFSPEGVTSLAPVPESTHEDHFRQEESEVEEDITIEKEVTKENENPL